MLSAIIRQLLGLGDAADDTKRTGTERESTPAALQHDVEKYGEVHAVLEDHDKHLEIRKGQVAWDHPVDGMFTIVVAGHRYPFPYDRVIRHYVPTDIWHAE